MAITEQEQQIILAAITAAASEPVDPNFPLTSEERVIEKVTQFNSMLSEKSRVVKKLRALTGQNGAEIKHISGVVLGVRKEASSQRGVIFLKTEPHERWNPRGIEIARTERLDSDGLALKMARELRELVGHRIVATVEVRMVSDYKVRVLSHYTVTGRDQHYYSEQGYAEARNIVSAEFSRMTNAKQIER
ncbi:hypothetical protein ACTXM3_09280 [Glutamicibacter arilaitensis]|uniref:hypothetical protein n=1 Tax=Glutamicibacter arilaitensis TaxID=256701 RepID=UPI003FCF4EAF